MSLVAERAGVAGRAGSRARMARRLLRAIAVAGVVAGLFVCYLRLSATYATGSDGASNALEAWDLLHGNWLLRGWTLTDVSFYPTELPEYAAVELVRGLRPDVVHVCAAITYTLLVLTAAALARGRARGREGWTRALIAAGIMVAPQLGNGVRVLLAQPDHVGTQLLLLAIFLLADRGRRRWDTVAAVGALLTIAVVADKIAIVDAVVPLAFACTVRAIFAATGRPVGGQAVAGQAVAGRSVAGRAVTAVRGTWFELSLAVAACGAVGAAQLVTAGISRLGGFALLPVDTGMITPGRVPGHLLMAGQDALNLLGGDVGVAAPGPPTVFGWLHAPGAALAAAAFCVAVWRLPSRDDLVSDLLAVGLVVNLAGFVASVIPTAPFDARELAAALPYGAVLAGRVLGPWLTRPRPERSWRRWRRPGLIALLALAGLGQLAALGYETTRPAAASPEAALAGWLAGRHLTTGLGTYTEDNAITLDSGGAVRMLTLSWRTSGAGGTVARLYQSSSAWYDPANADATFVVTGSADGTADLIPKTEILALAGPPAATYQFQTFTIMVWNRNLLTLLAAPPSPAPGDIGHL